MSKSKEQSILECVYVALELGFEQASQSTLPRRLKGITPTGGTSMRDSIAMGTSLMIKFRDVSIKLGVGNLWNFVHIILTDGADADSEISSNDLKGLMLILSQILPKEFLKTIYIGVDIENDYSAKRELAELAAFGQSDIYNVNNNQIDEIFERIKVSLGVLTQTRGVFARDNQGNQVGLVQQQRQGVLMVEKQRYMVLFNIDMSGSMCSKWPKVCSAVERFMKQLGDEDLVCGIVFNTNCCILTGQRAQQAIRQQNIPRNPPPQQQNQQQLQNNNQNNNQYVQQNYQQPNNQWSNNQKLAALFILVILVCGIGAIIWA